MANSKKIKISVSNLQSIDVFASLSNQELSLLSHAIIYKQFDRKSALYIEHCPLNYVIIILNGIVKQKRSGSKSNDITIRFAKKGEIIGFRSFLTNEPACATAEAVGDVEAGFIPGATLCKLMTMNSQFSMNLLKRACLELDQTQNFIVNVAQKQIRERVAEVLIQLKETFDTDDEDYLLSPLSRKEIASAVGTVPESVIRMLSEFKRDRLIELNGRRIRFINEQKLKRIGFESVYKFSR